MQGKLPQVIENYRFEIDSELKSILYSYKMPVYSMLEYHMGWIDQNGNIISANPGKMLRPSICLLACEAVGSDSEFALPAAAAVELVHNYSLIHDDIQDNDSERRHRPTVWRIWGKEQAINAGTAMRILAGKALSRVVDHNVPAEKYYMMQSILDDATLRLIEGQYLDIEFENRFDVNVEDYIEMIKGKTAALISCSLQLGAISGSGSRHEIEKFGEFGECLGIAFQVRDDFLGIWGDEEYTGKPRGNDIQLKKKSFPIVYALNCRDNEIRDRLIEIYSREFLSDNDVLSVMVMLDEVYARDYVQVFIDDYISRAYGILYQLDIDSNSRGQFSDILNFLNTRNF